MQEWATEELKQADLGDARRTKRLIRIIEDLSAQLLHQDNWDK
ncbi:MAG: transposase DNA-binding-containing protein [Nostoc sp. DedSLP03]|nr:transposase DNA-binding-containing protein [Nostoc sp. DedSLP03]MDZ7965033.1 transposase DNA-binding-containing protein [Nostoc sp. DedSLP03]